jgi:cell division protein FtsQ
VWALALVALIVAALLWLRDSPLVSVQRVTVTGLSGPEAVRVTTLLQDAAHDMTTLHVRGDQLRAVVEPYPVVKDLQVKTDFPHGMTITVIENTPVAAVMADGAKTPVSGDGRLLRGAGERALPIVPLRVPPGGDHVVDATAKRAIAALAAAPTALRDRVERAGTTREGGLTLQLRNGPALRFGGADRLAAKWAAAAAVLADNGSAGATYLDLRYPERPAAGGLEDPATQRDPESVNAADPTQSSTSAAPSASVTP